MLRKYLKNGVDSRQNRAYMVQRALVVAKRVIDLPESLYEDVREDSDPVLVFYNHIENVMPEIVDFIFDFKGDDQTFVNQLKANVGKHLHALVDDLTDDFEGGHDSAIMFLKENIKQVLTAACEPTKARMVVMLGTDPIVKFIVESHKMHKTERVVSEA